MLQRRAGARAALAEVPTAGDRLARAACRQCSPACRPLALLLFIVGAPESGFPRALAAPAMLVIVEGAAEILA
jgi:hypothetical protein